MAVVLEGKLKLGILCRQAVLMWRVEWICYMSLASLAAVFVFLEHFFLHKIKIGSTNCNDFFKKQRKSLQHFEVYKLSFFIDRAVTSKEKLVVILHLPTTKNLQFQVLNISGLFM